MKHIIKILSSLVIGASMLTLTSCLDTAYYEPSPNTPPVSGFRYTFNDDFNNDRYGWNFSDNANRAYGEVKGGIYYFDYYANESNTYSSTVEVGMHPNNDFLIQTAMRSTNAVALNFGVGNREYGYSFFVDNAGGYFALFDEGAPNIKPTTIIDWTYSPAISTGWNDIEIERLGSRWIGYINGREVFNVAARTLYGTRVGFLNFGNSESDLDYLTVKWM